MSDDRAIVRRNGASGGAPIGPDPAMVGGGEKQQRADAAERGPQRQTPSLRQSTVTALIQGHPHTRRLLRVCYSGEPESLATTSSPPLRVTRRANSRMLMFSLIRRTDPSPKATLAPPGWKA